MQELETIQLIVLPAAVGLVAFLYSSVGHGGATGYLAAAALLGFPAALARPGALWMNCCVAGIAFFRFYRSSLFDIKVFWPLASTSIPCAWIGSQLQFSGRSYAILLGAALLVAGWFLGWGGNYREVGPSKPLTLPIALLAGAGLGLLAGLTGIGGGVFLTPLLIFLDWTPAKVAGGISALFIVVNSAAGLVGLGHQALVWEPVFVGALALGIAGALCGAYLGANRWRTTAFRRALAGVLWIASAKLILTGK